MENGSGLSAADVLALTRNNNNCYDGMGGANFWWVIVFLIIAGMFNGNGFGFGNNGFIQNDALLNEEFIKRDIFNTNQNVSNTSCTTQRDVLTTTAQTQRDVLENRYTTQLGLQNLQAQNQNCCCETQKEIIESRYNNSLGQAGIQKDLMQNRYDNALGQANIQRDVILNGRDLQAQLAQCCCDIKTENAANTQKILDKMSENEINTLRDRLQERDRELQSAQFQISQVAQSNNIISQLRPTPIPAYLTCSPYQSYNYGCGCGYGVSSVV